MPSGITRRFDRLGRIVVPVEIRSMIGITEETEIDISYDYKAGHIILEPAHGGGCVFCAATEDIREIEFPSKINRKKKIKKMVCADCLAQLAAQSEGTAV